MWIDPQRVGTYNIFCAEFCGKDHAAMTSTLHVKSQKDYAQWLEDKINERYKALDLGAAMDPKSKEITSRDGPTLYGTYCASCHGPEGKGGLVAGARNLTSIEGWKNGVTVTAIFRTLTEGLEGTQMRSFAHLPAWDRFALAYYVLTFSTGEDRPEAEYEDFDALFIDYSLDQDRVPPKRRSIEEAMQLVVDEAKTR
jgi:mono/diheme cytochrome c family protein